MAQPYVTGPVGVYVGVGPSGAPLFLGHGERAPKPSIRRGQEPVMCDLGGTQIPFDIIYQGQEALIRVDLTRWNEEVYQIITNVISASGNFFPGVDEAGSVGALYLQENFAYPVWLTFPYSSKPAMNTLPNGYRFLQCVLESPDDREPGTGANRLSLIWHAYRGFDPDSGVFSLYDYDMSQLGPIN